MTIQAQVLTLLRRASQERGVGLLLITHDLGVVAETAQSIAVMYAGHIVEQGSAANVLRSPANPYTRDLVNSIPTFERRGSSLTTIAGSVPSPAAFPTGCRFHTRCRYAIAECASAVPPLVQLPDHRAVRCIRHAELAQTLSESAVTGAS